MNPRPRTDVHGERGGRAHQHPRRRAENKTDPNEWLHVLRIFRKQGKHPLAERREQRRVFRKFYNFRRGEVPTHDMSQVLKFFKFHERSVPLGEKR